MTAPKVTISPWAKLGSPVVPKDQRQTDCGETEKQTKVQTVKEAHQELVKAR